MNIKEYVDDKTRCSGRTLVSVPQVPRSTLCRAIFLFAFFLVFTV